MQSWNLKVLWNVYYSEGDSIYRDMHAIHPTKFVTLSHHSLEKTFWNGQVISFCPYYYVTVAQHNVAEEHSCTIKLFKEFDRSLYNPHTFMNQPMGYPFSFV